MDFISVEEFLKQPKGIQKVFINWWKPSIGDLYLLSRINLLNGNGFNEVNCIRSSTLTKRIKECEDFKCLLLTEGQLREFIEDKTNSKIEVSFYIGGYEIDLYDIEKFDEYNDERILIDCFESCGNDLLQAYWKVALEIAKGNVENE